MLHYVICLPLPSVRLSVTASLINGIVLRLTVNRERNRDGPIVKPCSSGMQADVNPSSFRGREGRLPRATYASVQAQCLLPLILPLILPSPPPNYPSSPGSSVCISLLPRFRVQGEPEGGAGPGRGETGTPRDNGGIVIAGVRKNKPPEKVTLTKGETKGSCRHR